MCPRVENVGWSLQAGGGYDLRLARRFALVPFANLVQVVAGSAEGLNAGEVAFGPSNPRYVQLGLGFRWY